MLIFGLVPLRKKFGLFPCDDQEKVAFAAHQLRDAAGVWWKSYKAQIAQGHQITWDEFCQVLEPIIFLLVLSLSRGKNFSS